MRVNDVLYILLSIIPAYFAYTYKGFAENCILDRENFGADKTIVLVSLIAYVFFVMFMTQFRITFTNTQSILQLIMFSFIITVMSMYYSKMFYNCDSDSTDYYFYGIAAIAGILPIVITATRNRV